MLGTKDEGRRTRVTVWELSEALPFPDLGAFILAPVLNLPFEVLDWIIPTGFDISRSKFVIHKKVTPARDFFVVMSGLEPPTHGFSVRCSTT